MHERQSTLRPGAPAASFRSPLESQPTDLYGLTRPELRALVESWGFSPVHAARIWKSPLPRSRRLRRRSCRSFPRAFASRLSAETRIGALPVSPETDSSDGFTRKYLLGLADGERIETVLMRFTGRVTACVSSQVGCAMGCVFCATGQMGYRRHLSAGRNRLAGRPHRARPRAAPQGHAACATSSSWEWESPFTTTMPS